MSAPFSRSVDRSIDLFLSWLSDHGYVSHDAYSLWSSRYGIAARRVYERNKMAGSLLVTPIVIADIFFPASARRNLPRYRYPISDAHFILGYCTLAQQRRDERYIEEAERVAQALLTQSLGSSYHGHCWGYPFNWMSKNGLWSRGTPLITTTPYCFEAMLALHQLTGKEVYRSVAQSVAEFAIHDLNQTVVSDRSVACSYSPIDSTMVINANAYRAMVLCEAWRHFGSSSMVAAAKLNINFVMEAQQEDGSWWYAAGNPSDLFVDNFHTCLVLKNLIKSNRILAFDELWECIARGYEYYLEHLIDASRQPRPFAKSSRLQLVSREIYDFAEGITCSMLMHQCFPARCDTSGLRERALSTAHHLANQLIQSYQLTDGHFVTREYFGVLRSTAPYIRWAQAQCFYALTNLLPTSTFHTTADSSSKVLQAQLTAQ